MRPQEIYILVACEESQAVTIAFRERGFNAFSCDIKNCSGGYPQWHIKGDAIIAMHSRKWDAIIAHPPCTFLTKASAVRLYPKKILNQERYKDGLIAREFFMKFIDFVDCDNICVENPISLRVFNLPRHTQQIEPYHHGHPVSKATRLWLKGFPLLRPTNIVEKLGTHLPSNVSANAYSGKNDKCTRDPEIASKTFPGIAKAMGEQWGDYLLKHKRWHF